MHTSTSEVYGTAQYVPIDENHPLQPQSTVQGALELVHELGRWLVTVTGMHAVAMSPKAGAHGELAGILMIHAYHAKQGRQRSKILIPDTAHGTNPASATLCGYKSINIKSGENGILTPEAVATLPAELGAQIKDAAESIDMDRLEGLIQEVSALDPNLADALSGLMENFEFDAMVALFDP